MTRPGYTPAVDAAYKAYRAAEKELLAAMQRDYPKGAQVRIHHDRGQFDATVTGWRTDGGPEICVRNHRTGKGSKWWAVRVEVLDAAQAAAKGAGEQ
ncbi:hypothetical protein [Delftia sp. ZNC0008]|uniref:hypothetical protein n=1 Tax=Delftia sp. ZNC0008 TaxID=1339242 RepID=UPI0006491B5F|nr:hypothetical protein [Delftia sp. ZNC0008]